MPIRVVTAVIILLPAAFFADGEPRRAAALFPFLLFFGCFRVLRAVFLLLDTVDEEFGDQDQRVEIGEILTDREKLFQDIQVPDPRLGRIEKEARHGEQDPREQIDS